MHHMQQMNQIFSQEAEQIRGIGLSLVAHPREADTSARGLIDELFPYIYEASSRMSSRAISAFLRDAHNVSISPSTITRSLKRSDKFIDGVIDEIEPLVRSAAEGFGDEKAWQLLVDEGSWHETESQSWPTFETGNDAADRALAGECLNSVRKLGAKWWTYGSNFRAAVLARMKKFESSEEKTEGD